MRDLLDVRIGWPMALLLASAIATAGECTMHIASKLSEAAVVMSGEKQ